jgi:hypothetical protein
MGVEIASSHRTLAYLANDPPCGAVIKRSCGCPADDFANYVDPATDDAPWYDPLVPESVEFQGVLLTRVFGVDTSPLSRSVTPSAGAGGFLGRLRLGPRVMTFEAVLYATSSCGMDYGKRWLVEALKGPGPDVCSPVEACVRVCCPPDVENAQDEPAALQGLLHAFGVGLLDAPTFSDLGDGRCCDRMQAATWTMAAEAPWLYEDLVEVGEVSPDPDTAHCITACDDICDDEPTTPCDEPARDFAYCEPWCRTDTECLTIPAGPDWKESATLIEVASPTSDVVRLIIKAYKLADGESCPPADPCRLPDNVIQVRNQPAGTTLKIDGRSRTVTLCCGDSSTAGDRYVSGQYGLLEWLDIGCDEWCFCVYASTEDLADDVTVSVSTAIRVGG